MSNVLSQRCGKCGYELKVEFGGFTHPSHGIPVMLSLVKLHAMLCATPEQQRIINAAHMVEAK